MKLLKLRSDGFTIIELIVVVSVIAVLATIVIVAYNGVTNNAKTTSLKSDLTAAAAKMKAYRANYGSYPTALSGNCPSAPKVDNNYCIVTASSNTLSSYAGTASSFNISISNGSLVYYITDSLSSAVQVAAPGAPTISSITAGNAQLSVYFTAGSDGGSAITNYQYSTNAGSSWSTVSPASTASPIVITGLTNGTSYPVVIRAVNAAGSGTQSNQVSASPTSATTFAVAFGKNDGTMGANSYTTGRGVIQSSDGGYVFTGDTAFGSGPNSYLDMFIVKYDSQGAFSWMRTFGGASINDYGKSVVQTNDGGYAVVGQTASYNSVTQMFINKYDSSGNLLWTRLWYGPSTTTGNSIVQLSDGSLVVTGGTGTDMFLAKFSSSGAPVWSNSWGGTGSETGVSVIQTADGGFAVTGITNSFGAVGYDLFVAKYTSSGALSWSKMIGGSCNEEFQSGASRNIVQLSDGSYVIYAQTNADCSFNRDLVIIKLDSSGGILWSKTWAGTNADYNGDETLAADGNVVIGGFESSDTTGSSDGLLAKINSSTGDLIWFKTYGTYWNSTYRNENYYGLALTADGGFAQTGIITLSYDYIGTLIKYDSNGNITNCPASQCRTLATSLSVWSPTYQTITATTATISPTTSTITATNTSITPNYFFTFVSP